MHGASWWRTSGSPRHLAAKASTCSELIQYYNGLHERKQIALLDGRPNQEGVFTLYRLPHGGAALRLNVCSRFRSSEMSAAPYPTTRLKAPMR